MDSQTTKDPQLGEETNSDNYGPVIFPDELIFPHHPGGDRDNIEESKTDTEDPRSCVFNEVGAPRESK